MHFEHYLHETTDKWPVTDFGKDMKFSTFYESFSLI
jgi:hypothetical protein